MTYRVECIGCYFINDMFFTNNQVIYKILLDCLFEFY